jgi:hypothetical protein
LLAAIKMAARANVKRLAARAEGVKPAEVTRHPAGLNPCTAEAPCGRCEAAGRQRLERSPIAFVQDADADTFTGVFVGWRCYDEHSLKGGNP